MSNTSGINRPTILWRFLVMIITGGVVRGQTTPGQNAVAFLKGQTMLDCSMQAVDTSMWSRTTDGTSNPVHITTACSIVGDNSAHYRTEQPGNNICRLIIANATMQQSGVFDCYAGLGDPAASLIVYNKSEVVENDQLNISCSISYNGATSPAPSLRPSPYWITSSEQDFTSVTYHSSANVVTLVATVKVQKPTVPLFHCNTIFEITGNTVGFNATPPHDNVTFGSTAELDVQYAPSLPNIVTTASGFSDCEAMSLACYSDANPSTNYNWTDNIHGNVTSAQNIIAEYGVNYTCTASNVIRNDVHASSSSFYETSFANSTCKFPWKANMHISGQSCYEDTCTCECLPATIFCYVNSYPPPSYEWLLPDGSRVEGQSVEAKINGVFVCRSYTLIDGWYLVEAYKSANTSGCVFAFTPTTTSHSTQQPSTTTSLSPPQCVDSSAELTAAIVLGILLAISIAFNTICMILLYRKGIFKRSDSTGSEVNKPVNNSEEGHYQDLCKETLAAKPEYEELPR